MVMALSGHSCKFNRGHCLMMTNELSYKCECVCTQTQAYRDLAFLLIDIFDVIIYSLHYFTHGLSAIN